MCTFEHIARYRSSLLSLFNLPLLFPVVHHCVDEEARFGESKGRDVLEFPEAEVGGCFFVTSGFFARTGGGCCGHTWRSIDSVQVEETLCWIVSRSRFGGMSVGSVVRTADLQRV